MPCGAVSSSTEEGVPQASSSRTRRAPRRRARSASSICRLGIERSDIIVIYHLLGHRVAFECHPATTPSIGAVSGVWRGRMHGGLKPVSHRVSVWVLSCVIDFPVSDAPRNTAGAALQNTSGAALVFDAVRATHESSARNTAGAANSAGAALVLNAVRATHEPSARKRGASAMNGRRGSGLRCRKVRGALCWRWWESKEKNIRTLVKTLMSVLTYSIRSAVQKAALRHNVVSAGFCAPM